MECAKVSAFQLTTGAGTGLVLTSDNSGNASWQIQPQLWAANGTSIYNNNGGKVGIGTATPGSELQITAANDSRFRIQTTSGGNLSFQQSQLSSDWAGLTHPYVLQAFEGSGTSDMAFTPVINSPASGLIIKSTGNIGIGTITPAAKLDVNGKGRFTAFQLPTGAGAGKILISDASGNATWATSSSASGWIVSGSNVFFNGSGAIGVNCTTIPTGYKLSVNGDIRARRMRVDHDTWCDYVFAESYYLRPLNELEAFIKTYKHLPEIPSEIEVKQNGSDLGEMDEKLLKKVEELTLYIIELEKRISKMENVEK
jgi:hypothetical protein